MLQTKVNYGPDDVLFSLVGQCPSTNHGGYVYKVCPFRQAHQSQTSLGTYEKFTTDAGGVMKMHFVQGQHCFANNKPRHMEVELVCTDAETPTLSDLIEYEVCAYRAHLHTYLACV